MYTMPAHNTESTVYYGLWQTMVTCGCMAADQSSWALA